MKEYLVYTSKSGEPEYMEDLQSISNSMENAKIIQERLVKTGEYAKVRIAIINLNEKPDFKSTINVW